MIKDVPLTGIFVNDQEAVLDFYTNMLGLEKIQDEPGRVRHQVELSRIHESKNTQSFRLRFCALLTGGGDPRVPLHSA